SMVLLDFTMFPLDKGPSVSQYVARSLEIIEASGLDYRTHAMGTILEGPLDRCLEVVRQCFEAMAQDCDRIECIIKFDYRRDRVGGLESKVAKVESLLGRPLKK
ncbi:MAG TPA: MTH1187 family thiamine-binding protein, partial [Thermoguttaceae bacterium]|nr:MTH1187 family thiamine-binding protein [Thermoguttaceae bacterium]